MNISLFFNFAWEIIEQHALSYRSKYFSNGYNLIIRSSVMFHKKRRHVGVRTKYAKIPIKTKLKFLRKVIVEGFSIRDSSTIFNINYSTAKTLMRQYKSDVHLYDLRSSTGDSNFLQEDCSGQKRCGYREIKSGWEEKIEQPSSGTSPFYLSADRSQSEKLKDFKAPNFKRIEIISCTAC